MNRFTQSYSRSIIPEIVACGLFQWMCVFFGAGIRAISISSQSDRNSLVLGIIYGIMTTLCIYALVGILYRKVYAWILANIILLAVTCCTVGNFYLASILRLPAVFMGIGGTFLLFVGRREFFRGDLNENRSDDQTDSRP